MQSRAENEPNISHKSNLKVTSQPCSETIWNVLDTNSGEKHNEMTKTLSQLHPNELMFVNSQDLDAGNDGLTWTRLGLFLLNEIQSEKKSLKLALQDWQQVLTFGYKNKQLAKMTLQRAAAQILPPVPVRDSLTHSKERDPQQGRVELPIWYKEDPCGGHVSDANGEHAEEAEERLPPKAVPHGAGDGGRQEHQNQADQHFALGQHARLMEVSPQAEGGERLDVELVGGVRRLGRGQSVHQSAELVLPALGDDVLHRGPMVAEVVGDLDGTGELDLLVTTVGRERHAAQLVSDEGHAAIL